MIIHAKDRPREIHDDYSGGQGRITFTDGAHTRTFAYEDGAVCVELILCGRLLYARFAM